MAHFYHQRCQPGSTPSTPSPAPQAPQLPCFVDHRKAQGELGLPLHFHPQGSLFLALQAQNKRLDFRVLLGALKGLCDFVWIAGLLNQSVGVVVN